MKRNFRSGYISILSVITLASIMLLMLTASFRHTIRNQEAQKKTQIRVDYTNREQAFLRAVLTEVPNSAIRNMMANSNSAGNEVPSRWQWIFERALAKANSEQALPEEQARVLGISGQSISGNTGNDGQYVPSLVPKNNLSSCKPSPEETFISRSYSQIRSPFFKSIAVT